VSPYKSRKFILSASVLAASVVLLWCGKLPTSEFKDLVLGAIGLYGLGNVGEKAVSKKGSAS
jgi:hypothetical protein